MTEKNVAEVVEAHLENDKQRDEHHDWTHRNQEFRQCRVLNDVDERVVDDQLRSDGCQDWQNQPEAQVVDDPKRFIIAVAPEKVFLSQCFDQFVKLWLFLLFDLRPSVLSFSESLLADELDDMDDEKAQSKQQQNHEVDIEVLKDGFAHGQVRVLD